MIVRPKVTMKKEARPVHRIHCGECNWELLIASQADSEIKCCSWCGWEDLEISKVSAQGGFQEMNCDVHGDFTVVLPSPDIDPLDFMPDLFCPFCK
ncbi:hypothetical protein SAMN04487963_1808 [Marinobacter zhejiangensis]|uniref:Cysteine-rich CPCC n=1 Tax=Marinobacter zhejiangensis TaxID=488535 RepID=A0A1I4P4W3_9GAMM|nr:hypothetical protein SAMN04487963_1808 [Marinobacter zhejiangensis]